MKINKLVAVEHCVVCQYSRMMNEYICNSNKSPKKVKIIGLLTE